MEAVSSAFSVITMAMDFISDNLIIMLFIAIPLAVGVIGAVVRAIGR